MRLTSVVTGLAAMVLLDAPSPHRAAAAPDNMSGMAILAAYVDSNGDLLDGAGAISANRTALGVYSVGSTATF